MLTTESWQNPAPNPSTQLRWSIENALDSLYDGGDEASAFAVSMEEELREENLLLVAARIIDYITKSDS